MSNISISFTLPTSANPERIWQYYTDFSLRKLWEIDLEEFQLYGELKSGVKGMFKLQNLPEMDVILSTILVNQEITEQFHIPDMGVLYFSHQIEEILQNQYAIKAVISLEPNSDVADKASHQFLKQISDDIIDKAFTLKTLVER